MFGAATKLDSETRRAVNTYRRYELHARSARDHVDAIVLTASIGENR
jgi:hypothetical protein